MTRFVKIMLMASVGLWGVIGGLGNLMDYSAGVEQVGYVLSMEGAKDVAYASWRSIHSPLIAHLAFAVIYLSKLATGALCLYCSARLLKFRKADTATFQTEKSSGILGLGISITMLFLAFIVFAGLLFEYWRVPTFGMITHHYAFIYTMCLTAFLLFLERRDEQPA
ncbi:MAG TPA: DUF2165 family protein [Allosphingosinicella sp.]|jgi:predicted small integral membrane protein